MSRFILPQGNFSVYVLEWTRGAFFKDYNFLVGTSKSSFSWVFPHLVRNSPPKVPGEVSYKWMEGKTDTQ